jgi:hypothetical protein
MELVDQIKGVVGPDLRSWCTRLTELVDQANGEVSVSHSSTTVREIASTNPNNYGGNKPPEPMLR